MKTTVCSLVTSALAAMLVTTVGVANATTIVITDGLVAAYEFSNNTNDSSGNNLHGTVYGATLALDRFGNANSSYRFDGVDDRIEVVNSDLLRLTSDMSLSLWINPAAVDEPANILRYGGAESSYSIGIPNGQLSYWHYGGIPAQLQNFYYGTIATDEWIHLAFVRDAAAQVVRHYQNGALVHTDSYGNVPINASPGPLNFGSYLGDQGETDFFMEGLLDDIAIFDRPLSSSEVEAMYNASNNAVPEPSTILGLSLALGLGALSLKRKQKESVEK